MSSSPTDVDSLVPAGGGHGAHHLSGRNVAITAAVAIVLHFPALIRKTALNGDEATIATMARVIRHGGTLYRDIVDRKPPGAFILYRLLEPVFGSWTLPAGRWVALTATVAAMWVLGLEAARRWPGVVPVQVAVTGIAAFSVLPAEDSRAVGFELLATLPAVLAFVLGARGRVVLAGCFVGAATLFKQPMIAGAVPLTVQCLTAAGPWPRRAVRLVGAGAATALVVVAGLVPFGFADAWSWFSGSGDNYLGGTDLSTVASVGLRQVGAVAGLTMGLVIIAVCGWWRRRVPSDLAVWLVVSLLATAIGLRFILHYFIQVLPPLVLLAAFALQGHFARGRLRVLTLAWWGGALAFSMWTVLAPGRFHDLPNVDRVAAAIDARTTPGQRIFVWGQAPEIYWVSDRDPSTRYPHIGFITGITPQRPGVAAYVLSQPGATENLLDDLEHDPPALVVDAAIAAVRGGDRYPLETSPVAGFVLANYCEVEVVDRIRLLAPCTT